MDDIWAYVLCCVVICSGWGLLHNLLIGWFKFWQWLRGAK